MRVVDCPKLGPLQIYQSLKLICTKIQIKQKNTSLYLRYFHTKNFSKGQKNQTYKSVLSVPSSPTTLPATSLSSSSIWKILSCWRTSSDANWLIEAVNKAGGILYCVLNKHGIYFGTRKKISREGYVYWFTIVKIRFKKKCMFLF